MKTSTAQPDTAALPSMVVESKFMQNFRVASAVDPGAGLESIRNRSGLTEFFSTGTDLSVHNYYPDTGTDTGFSSAALGVQASTLGVTVNASGAIVVFAASGTTLFMVTEQPGQAVRWSAPVQVPLQLPTNSKLIAGIYTAAAGANSYVALLIQTQSTTPGATYQLALATMAAGQVPSFAHTSLVFSSLNCAWLGATPATMQFVCADGALVAVSPITLAATRLPMQGSFHSLSVCSAVDGSGTAQLYGVLSDGNAYRLLNTAGAYSWAQLTQGRSFTQIAAEPDGGGNVHLLCVAGSAKLYHLAPESGQVSGFGTAIPIVGNASTVAMTSNDAGQVEAFVGGTGPGSLNYLAWDPLSTNWEVQAVEVEQGSAVEDFSSYASDVQVRDANGAPLPAQGVVITASESTRITVNGASYFIDAVRAAYVTTNGSGAINIQQQTRALSVPTLLLTVPGLMPPGDTIAIAQDAGTQATLAALTGPALYDATTASGAQVLPPAYHTQAQAQAVATAISQVMGLAATQAVLPAAHGMGIRRARPGVHAVRTDALDLLGRLTPPAQTAMHWRLSSVGGAVRHVNLSPAGAQAHLQSLRAQSQVAGGFLEFIGGIGDIISGAANGLIEIVQTTVTAIGNAIDVAIQFVVDGVTYLYEAAVSAVEQLFDIAEAIFAQVKVFFQTLYEWLAFLFNWPDMVRTAKAMSYTVTQFMGFFQGAVGGIQAYFDNGMGELQSTIATLFNQAIAAVGTGSIGGYADSQEPDDPAVQGPLSNNPLYNALLDNAGAMTSVSGTLARTLAQGRALGDANPYAAVEQAMQTSAAATTSNTAFAPLNSYYTQLGGAGDNVFTALLQTMLGVVRDLIQAVLAGLQAVVDALLQALAQMIGVFTASLNEDWNVPFLSPLFAYATDGMPMSTVNLISLILAIPATVIYKGIYHQAPFASDADVAAFEQAWNAGTLLQASGLAPRQGLARRAAVPAAEGWTGVLPRAFAPVVAVLGAVSLYFYAGFTAVTDAIPEGNHVKPLAICGFVTEVLGQAATCPWFYAAGAIGCNDGTSAGYLNWTYANLGVALDLLYLATGESIPSDVQTVISHLYGNVHLAMAAMASNGQPAGAVAANMLWCIPETGKILKFSGIAEATAGISLVVLAVLDAVCFPVSATLATVNTVAAIPPPASSAPRAAAVRALAAPAAPSTLASSTQGALPC